MSSAKVLDLPAPAPEVAVVTVEMRGRDFTFREITQEEYDKLLKQASHQEADADGIMQDVADNALLLRLMILKSAVEPKLTPDYLNSCGMRMYRGISRVVNELHFEIEPVKRKDVKEAADEEEETPKGNS